MSNFAYCRATCMISWKYRKPGSYDNMRVGQQTCGNWILADNEDVPFETTEEHKISKLPSLDDPFFY